MSARLQGVVANASVQYAWSIFYREPTFLRYSPIGWVKTSLRDSLGEVNILYCFLYHHEEEGNIFWKNKHVTMELCDCDVYGRKCQNRILDNILWTQSRESTFSILFYLLQMKWTENNPNLSRLRELDQIEWMNL